MSNTQGVVTQSLLKVIENWKLRIKKAKNLKQVAAYWYIDKINENERLIKNTNRKIPNLCLKY